jgi:uncharacterized repeat protein (TIGR01451 family)
MQARAFFNDATVTTTQTGFERSAVPQNGIVNIDVALGTYSTAVHLNSAYFIVAPSSISSTFSTYFNKDSISFAVQPAPAKRDLIISMIPTNTARPGFVGTYRIFYKNVGTDIVPDGEVTLTFNSLKTVFGSSTPAPGYTNYGDTVKWHFSNLKPFDSASIMVNMFINTPPYANNGDTIKFLAFIDPVAGDLTPSNDTVLLKQRLVGSYDPNDKIENNSGIIGSDYITAGKYLNYTIRFQNTGTDTAFNVIVRDTLDNKLDWSTFEMIAASHPYTVSITGQNKLEWTFANINLPDSNVNEPLSHGYLSYRVKPKSTAVVGDVINNLASIYFDFNLPVATNNAITLVQDNFTALPLQLLSFTGQLGDNTVQLNWKTANETAFERFEVERSFNGVAFDKIGSIGFVSSVHVYGATDNVAAVSSKHIFYRLKLIDRDGKFNYSKVVAFNINLRQNQFSVYPNPARTEIFVSITSGKNENLNLKIIDGSGRIVSEQQRTVEKGNNVFSVNTSKLKAGNFILQIVGGGEKGIARFTIMN